jgi:L-lactate utilization protein LutC
VARGVSARKVVITADTDAYRTHIDQGLADADAEAIRPTGAEWRGVAAAADLGITSARLAAAATGSILIVPGPMNPRVASLLPPAHLAIVPVDRLVGGLEDVMPVLTEVADRSSAPVLITGPSRTSDIEMTTVYGVHGPRVVRVLLVEPG